MACSDSGKMRKISLRNFGSFRFALSDIQQRKKSLQIEFENLVVIAAFFQLSMKLKLSEILETITIILCCRKKCESVFRRMKEKFPLS